MYHPIMDRVRDRRGSRVDMAYNGEAHLESRR
jgi:hypothetical protein